MRLEDNSHADFLFPEANLWLKTGINDTESAPEVKIKNMKSGIVNAAVYASIPVGYVPK